MVENAAQILDFEVTTSAARLTSRATATAANSINRDLSLIEFFRRVLEEAQDHRQPLLERLKFIAILSSNLDEFFMIRVSGLKEKLGREAGVSPDGYSTPELLAAIRERVVEISQAQMQCLTDEILPALAREGIYVRSYEDLSEQEGAAVDKYFDQDIYPLLTPQAVDPTHPFPYISGLSINIGLMVKPQFELRSRHAHRHVTDDFFVRIKVPPTIPRLIVIPGTESQFVLAEDLVIANISRLVPGAAPSLCHTFRITRDADIDLRESETEDLLEAMEENLRLRRFGTVVRLEIAQSMPTAMAEYLKRSLDIAPEDLYMVDGPIDVGSLSSITGLNRADLKDAPIRAVVPSGFDRNTSLFDVIRREDVLLHHPYMPYSLVTDLLREAVHDPDVLAIKMCLYRIGAESPIAPLLIEASESGKQVTALIEIKARFDEENNIEWGRRLEEAGVHVVYGLLGLKTHCKTTLIVRREDGRLNRYVHLATGNYNPETSAFYTDLGLLTTNESIGADATELFNYLTVYSLAEDFKELVVAPLYLRNRMLELIRGEIAQVASGRRGRIIAKMNRLADAEIVNALYEASCAGVQIDLIVRGVCTLRPGVPGLSENIRVRSIVGRLLEHSRIYYFENGGDCIIYTGSADWMPRNLDRRIEVLAPVHSPSIRKYLRDEFLEAYLSDNLKARELRSDGSYSKVAIGPDEAEFDSQMSFCGRANVISFGS